MPRFAIGAALHLAVMSACAAQSCQPFWVKPGPFDGGVYGAALVFDDGMGEKVYGAGRTGLSLFPTVVRWDGHGWQPIAQGLPNPLYDFSSIIKLEDALGLNVFARVRHYVGLQLISDTWKWSGDRWVPGPPGLFGVTPEPYAFPHCSFDDGTGPAIYGLAAIDDVGFVARWTGTQWQGISEFSPGSTTFGIRSVTLRDGPALLVAGTFTAIGGVPVRNIAAWNGQAWRSVGGGVNMNSFRDLEVFDRGSGPDLYIAANAYAKDGSPHYLMRWDGQVWSPVIGAPLIGKLRAFNDGSGPALFATGGFSSAGGVEAHNIAKFDGTSWHALGAGSGLNSNFMLVYNDPRGPSLFVAMGGGSGSTAGGGIVGAGSVQWVGCPNCYVNCDTSTAPPRLNINDFMCFLNRYAVSDPYANCDVDATINVADFLCFLNKFAAGCP